MVPPSTATRDVRADMLLRTSRPPSPAIAPASSLRERLVGAARREADARVQAEVAAVDNEELRAQLQYVQQAMHQEGAVREDLEHRLTVRRRCAAVLCICALRLLAHVCQLCL